MIAVVDYRKGNLKSVERGLAAAGACARITADAAEIAAADAIVLPGVGAFADAAATMGELGQTDVIRDRVRAGVPFLGICLGEHLMFECGVEGSPEGSPARGLGLLPGCVTAMPRRDAQGNAFKVPHVGWNTIEVPIPALDGFGGGTVLAQSCSHEQPTGAPARAEIASADSPVDCQPCGTARGTSPESVELPNSPASAFPCPLFDGIAPGEWFYFTHSYIAPTGGFTVAETTHSVRFTSAVQYGERAFGVQFHPEKSSDAGARVLANFVAIARGI